MASGSGSKNKLNFLSPDFDPELALSAPSVPVPAAPAVAAPDRYVLGTNGGSLK